MTHAIIEADVVRYLRGNRWLVQNGYLPKYHAVLCDPPYGLAFMGKHWDDLSATEFQAWVTEWAELLLDYVYPGALLVAFGGTRTYHRLAAGIEDAGWEIADCITWAYGSDFPKSLAIDKAIDREAGAEREVVGESLHSANRTKTTFHGAEYKGGWTTEAEGARTLTAPATPLAARWSGYGTALKPAYEPAIIARAPRGKHTYAGLAREFGTGALAIDAGRIGTAEVDDYGRSTTKVNGNLSLNRSDGWGMGERPYTPAALGRWPANFALVCSCDGDGHADDCPVRVIGEQSGERPVSGSAKNGRGSVVVSDRSDNLFGRRVQGPLPADEGTAARFFYTAKASAWERIIPNGVSLRSDLSPETKAVVLKRLQELNIQPIVRSGSVGASDRE